MTYTESAHAMEDTRTKTMTIGRAVKEVLVQAFQQDRVTLGLFESVDILDRETDKVQFCVLPEGKTRDVATRIQHTLIEAFCRENEVKLLKVDCPTKLSTIYTANVSKETRERMYSADFSCVLVMRPDTASCEDQFVSDYCENFMLGGVFPHGNIEIPEAQFVTTVMKIKEKRPVDLCVHQDGCLMVQLFRHLGTLNPVSSWRWTGQKMGWIRDITVPRDNYWAVMELPRCWHSSFATFCDVPSSAETWQQLSYLNVHLYTIRHNNRCFWHTAVATRGIMLSAIVAQYFANKNSNHAVSVEKHLRKKQSYRLESDTRHGGKRESDVPSLSPLKAIPSVQPVPLTKRN